MSKRHFHYHRAATVSLSALLLSAPATAQSPTVLPPITIATPEAKAATLERSAIAKPATPSPSAGAPGTQAKANTPAALPQVAATVDAINEVSDASRGGIATTASGSAATVITATEIERQQIRTAVEVLRSLPGVTVSRSGGSGGLTQVRLRGGEANQTLVLIDGIQANTTADGEFDFSNLSAADIERIEVVRGPLSGLYGTGAVGGVINITTKKGRGPATVTLRSELGSFRTRDVSARVQGGNDVGHFSASGQWRQSDGYNVTEKVFSPTGEPDGFRLGSFAFNGGLRLAPNVTLDGTLRHVKKRADRDGFDFFGTGTAIDDASRLSSSVWLAGLALKADALDGKLTHEVRIDNSSTVNRDLDLAVPAFPYNTVNDGQRLTASYAATYRLDAPAIWGKHAITGLVQTEREAFTPLSDFEDGIKRTRERLSFAGEWRATYGQQVDITAGARRDNNDHLEDATTWRLSSAWRIPGTGVRPHASVGTAVKAPSMFEQFGSLPNYYVPNPLLKSERAQGFDAGLEVSMLGGKAIVDVTYFRTTVTDKIVPLYFPDFTSTSVNDSGESKREGIEVASRFIVAPGVTLGLAYTYTDATTPTGAREIRRPPHSGRVDFATAFAGGKGTVNLAATYNGAMSDRVICVPSPLCTPGFTTLDSVWLLSAAASYKLQPNVELFGRVENALDRQYQEVFGYNTPGIAAFAGVKVTFGPGASK